MRDIFSKKLWQGGGNMVDQERLLLLFGHQLAASARSSACSNVKAAEFGVFSQFGEDGIIQYLLGRVPIEHETFIEIGVQDYRESNTRFLLLHDNWRGLIVDADNRHLRSPHNERLRWRHTLHMIQEFVTKDNIDLVVSKAGFASDVGLFSLDVDGNDYWIFEALEAIQPRIVILEYNSLFGPHREVTVPYQRDFSRFRAHYSGLYWGASLKALTTLSEAKGYELAGSNRAGNNAFFVRNDLTDNLVVADPIKAWVPSRFRDSRNANGELNYITGHEAQRKAIEHLPLIDLQRGTQIKVADL